MSTLPANIDALIAEHIDSVVRLEVLLLLARDPGLSHGAEDLARELRIDPRWAATEARELVSRGLASQAVGPGEPRFVYAPRTGALAEAVSDLAQAYAQRRVAIVAAIYRAPEEGGPDPVQSFADAFDLRRRVPRGKSPPVSRSPSSSAGSSGASSSPESGEKSSQEINEKEPPRG